MLEGYFGTGSKWCFGEVIKSDWDEDVDEWGYRMKWDDGDPNDDLWTYWGGNGKCEYADGHCVLIVCAPGYYMCTPGPYVLVVYTPGHCVCSDRVHP